MADLSDLVDVLGQLRYSMPTAQKEAIAIGGELPGAPKDTSAEQEASQRYAAGYLHTKAHPTISQYSIPAANFLHGLFGDKEALQSQAQAGHNRALIDLENKR